MRLGSRPRSWSISPARLRPRTRTGRRATAFEPLVWLANLDYVDLSMSKTRNAKYKIGQVVRHRLFPFRGVVFDIDPVFNNTEEWWLAIPEEIRPHKDQPFYHLFAENAESEYIAYVSDQNLLPHTSEELIRHSH